MLLFDHLTMSLVWCCPMVCTVVGTQIRSGPFALVSVVPCIKGWPTVHVCGCVVFDTPVMSPQSCARHAGHSLAHHKQCWQVTILQEWQPL